MTESGGPYCGARLDLDLPASKHGSCGHPFAGIEVRIDAVLVTNSRGCEPRW